MLFSLLNISEKIAKVKKNLAWYRVGDLNSYGLLHWYLKPARIPIPPTLLRYAFFAFMMKLTNKQKRGIRRQADLDLGTNVPITRVFVSKKIYTRKKKHKNENEKY